MRKLVYWNEEKKPKKLRLPKKQQRKQHQQKHQMYHWREDYIFKTELALLLKE
jgi:hypothetical protein